ncbi:basic proline-rich protein-like [Equus quagga]|uniref:basic proline-rich protein-like n=1 Tax=Equus quagga TaxID=89248 RepID=UPI001EE20FA3|nr:basic proline-rich protein-like [Equus quagga]
MAAAALVITKPHSKKRSRRHSETLGKFETTGRAAAPRKADALAGPAAPPPARHAAPEPAPRGQRPRARFTFSTPRDPGLTSELPARLLARPPGFRAPPDAGATSELGAREAASPPAADAHSFSRRPRPAREGPAAPAPGPAHQEAAASPPAELGGRGPPPAKDTEVTRSSPRTAGARPHSGPGAQPRRGRGPAGAQGARHQPDPRRPLPPARPHPPSTARGGPAVPPLRARGSPGADRRREPARAARPRRPSPRTSHRPSRIPAPKAKVSPAHKPDSGSDVRGTWRRPQPVTPQREAAPANGRGPGALGGKRRGLGPAGHAAPIPRPPAQPAAPPPAPTRPPPASLQHCPSPAAARPGLQRKEDGDGAALAVPPPYPPQARGEGCRPPSSSAGTAGSSRPPPPSAAAREPRARTQMEARAGGPRRPEGKRRGRREAEAGAGARATREPIGRAA